VDRTAGIIVIGNEILSGKATSVVLRCSAIVPSPSLV